MGTGELTGGASAVGPGAGGELDRSLLHGLAWTGAGKWTIQLLSWVSTIVVARLLTPTDYGLVGMAALYLAFVALVNEFGLGGAIVQRRDLDDSQIARLGGLSVALGVFFFASSVALSGPIASFFGDRAVRPIVAVLGVSLVLTALQVLPRSLLTRDLQFRTLAWVDGAEALSATVVTLLCAVLGLRYWALVFGQLTGRLASTLLLAATRWHRHAWPSGFATIAAPVRFGWHLVVSRIAWYAYTNADFLVVGRLLGKGPLGAYTLGWNIASIPVERVSSLVTNVASPVFAAVQRDHAALRRYIGGLTEGLALITFPASIGMALVADELVLVLLGEAWRPAIMPLRLLSLWAGVRCVMTLLPLVVVSTGHSKRSMQFSLLATLVLPPLFYLGSHWGTTGVALGWLVGYPLVAIPSFWRTALRLTEMPARSYLRALWPATSATLVMAVLVLGFRWSRPPTWPSTLCLGADMAVGAVTYGAVVYFAHGARLRAFMALLRSMRS